MQRAQTKQDVRLADCFACPHLTTPRPQRATEFSSKRKALNEQFTRCAAFSRAASTTNLPGGSLSSHSWVKAQQTARPDECWADEARQFLEYVGQLKARRLQPLRSSQRSQRAAQEEFADVLGTPAEPAAKAAEAVTQQARAAPAPAPAPAPAQAASVPASAPSLFSAPPAPAAPFSVPSPFGAPLAGGFSFGAAPTMSFGGGTNPFSAPQPAAAAEDAEGTSSSRKGAQRARSRLFCGAEDEPERPPSPSVHKSSAEDDGEQVLFEAKSKLFFLGEVISTQIAHQFCLC